jgi:sigma-B regulation protein RsbU (phosphoserine phosphatase)
MYGEADFDLTRAVQRVSIQMFTYSAAGQFATLFCGLLSPETGRVRYVNAGHNPPLILRADGRLDRLESTGLMVGAFDFATWEERECELASGDTLVVYSDGVTEANNPALEEFGEERLRYVLLSNRHADVEEMIVRLRDEVKTFAAGAPASDDATLLMVKRTE